MRAFDHQGLLLAEYLGKLFEKSVELNCSSPIFLRRFLHSELLKSLDQYASPSLDVIEGIQSIQEQFGDTSYGKEKYSASAMFWIGYMYMYIAYTRENSAKYIMKLFGYRQMNAVYYSYHTQDPEWCVRSLLELNDMKEEMFDKNYRIKCIMKASGKY